MLPTRRLFRGIAARRQGLAHHDRRACSSDHRPHRAGDHGAQPGPQHRPQRPHHRGAQPHDRAHDRAPRRVRRRGRLRRQRVAGGAGGRHRPTARDRRDGQGRRGHRRRDRRAGATAGRGRHRRGRRQRALRRHRPAPGGAGRARPALRRHGCLRRRGGRPPRPLDHGRRLGARLRAPAPGGRVDRGRRRRHPLLRPRRPRRCGPLREDGAQRHRVRRHAAHRRVLRPAALGARPRARRRWPTSSRSGTAATWSRSSSR